MDVALHALLRQDLSVIMERLPMQMFAKSAPMDGITIQHKKTVSQCVEMAGELERKNEMMAT